jgi:membrane protein
MAKKLTPKSIFGLVKDAANGFIDDKVIKLSAALAYYTVFSIGPTIIIIIYLAGVIYGKDAVQGTVFEELRDLVGAQAAAQIQDVIRNVALSNRGSFAAIFGTITLIIGATTVFAEIQDSINDIWGLKPKPKRGWLKMLTNRLLSFSVIVSLGFILLVSLIINGLIETLMDGLKARFPDVTVTVLYILNLVITFAIITSLFSII